MKKALIVILILAQAACSTTEDRAPLGTTLGPYNFAYSITNQRTNQIVQVFDDGKNTYIQFFPDFLKNSKFEATSEKGGSLCFVCNDNKFCKAPSISEKFYIHFDTHSLIAKEVMEGEIREN